MKNKRGTIKLMALVLALAALFTLAGCGAQEQKPEEQGTQIADALTLLNTVWDSYGDEEKFPAAGGDFSEENMNTEGPGKFGLEDTQSLDSMLGLPQEAAGMVDDAASLMHMMNANTFTCAAFRTAEGADTAELAEALEESVMNRQWMCGFPDKLVIFKIGGYVVSAFGNEELIDTFRDKTTAAYPEAELVCEKAIV